MTRALFIFDTHPIQYRAPVFKSLFEKTGKSEVFYFNSSFDSHQWWFHEKGKHSKEDFGLNLQAGYPQKVLGTRRMSLLRRFFYFKKLLKDRRPEAVLIYGYYQTEHWILRFWCAHLKIPILFVGETYDWRGSLIRKTLKSSLVKYFFKGVAGFISIGEKNTRYYQKWDIENHKITTAHYCTDARPFLCGPNEAQETRNQTRKSLGISNEAFVLIFVGRLFKRKRPEDLLKIHQILSKKYPIYTLMVGQGELGESLKRENTDPHILWLGFKNQIELKKIYYASDLLVVPSQFETWGLVVNEAFSCGRPALVTQDCGVCGDLLEEGINGQSYGVGDIESAAQVIEDLIQSPSKMIQWGIRAKEKVLNEYQPEHFAQRIIEAWQKTI